MPSAASQARNKKKKQKQKQKQLAQAAGAGAGAGVGVGVGAGAGVSEGPRQNGLNGAVDDYETVERYDEDEGELLDEEDDDEDIGEGEEDELTYEDDEDDDGQQAGLVASSFPGLPAPPGSMGGIAGSHPASAATTQLHHEMLGTASALYSQIESAAAAALSGHFHNHPTTSATNIGGVGAMGEEDDAYWLSLPSHLRSFIRSALPLAAGLSTSSSSPASLLSAPSRAGPGSDTSNIGVGNIGQGGQISLTPDQMAAAAAQLAQVVQNGWASTLAKEPAAGGRNPPSSNSTTTTVSNSGNTTTTTTIPLGAFALPLHPHPDSPESNAAFHAAAQAAAAQAANYPSGNSNNLGPGSPPPPFPSLASLQASLQQLAQMHTGFGALPGSPFTASTKSTTGSNTQQATTYPMMHGNVSGYLHPERDATPLDFKHRKSKKKKGIPSNPPPPMALPLPPAPVLNGKVSLAC